MRSFRTSPRTLDSPSPLGSGSRTGLAKSLRRSWSSCICLIFFATAGLVGFLGGRAGFAGARLTGADLIAANLTGADLTAPFALADDKDAFPALADFATAGALPTDFDFAPEAIEALLDDFEPAPDFGAVLAFAIGNFSDRCPFRDRWTCATFFPGSVARPAAAMTDAGRPDLPPDLADFAGAEPLLRDRKSTRLNSSH